MCLVALDPAPYPDPLWLEQKLKERVHFPVRSLPERLAAAGMMHAWLRARADGWDRDRWSLLNLSPAGTSCLRETSAQCFKWKPCLALSASSEKRMNVVFCVCIEGLENKTDSVSENDNLLQPFLWALPF